MNNLSIILQLIWISLWSAKKSKKGNSLTTGGPFMILFKNFQLHLFGSVPTIFNQISHDVMTFKLLGAFPFYVDEMLIHLWAWRQLSLYYTL